MTTENATPVTVVLSTADIRSIADASPIAAAESYAQRGFRVVPLYSVIDGVCSCERGADCGGAGKHPRIKKWQQNASGDPAQVAEWFQKWPRANVGLAMGGPERIIALDIDGADGRASLAKLEQLYFPLPETLTSRSGRPDGGEHRLFVLAEGHDLDAIKNNAGRIGMKRGSKKTDPRPFPALDVRGDGGQIVVCPSVHKSGHPYAWTNEAPIAVLPKWLYELLVPPADVVEAPPVAQPSLAMSMHDRHDKYATVALERACDELRGAPKGTRNDSANREAYSIGQLVGAGLIRHADAEARLLDAMRAGGWDATAVRTLHTVTVRRALNDGARSPKVIPDLPARPYHGSPPALRIESRDRWTALEALLDELGQVPSEARNERALERPFLNAVLAVIESDRTPEGARLVERLKSLGIRVNTWKMALRSRHKEQLDEQAAAEPPAENEDQPKRTIIVKPGELGNAVRQAMTLLRDDPSVYVRDGELVTASPADGPDASPKLSLLKPETVRVWLSDAAKWLTPVNESLASIDPPMPVVAGVCADPTKKDVRRLDAIVEAPTLGPRGELIEEPGYHELARLILMPRESFPRVPEQPTRDDARAAYELLEGLFADFEHEAPVDKSICVAAILTMLARPAITGAVPGFCFSANGKGTGKTLQVKAILALVVGREVDTPGWPVEEAELEKKLDTAAIEGDSYMVFDNLEKPFEGAILCTYLTASRVRPRLFGVKRSVSCPWRAVIFATGNNLRCGRDINRRVLVSRIRTTCETPWLRQRTFRIPKPLVEYILEHRARLVIAALTMIRAWLNAKRPRGTQPTLGSFEAWSRFVPDVIEWAGGTNPLLRAVDEPDEGETDEDRYVRVVLHEMPRLDTDGRGLTVTSLLKLLYPSGRPPRAGDAPDGFDDLREALDGAVRAKSSAGVPVAAQLGRWFGQHESRPLGGSFLEQVGSHGHVSRWRVVKVPPMVDADADAVERAERAAIQGE